MELKESHGRAPLQWLGKRLREKRYDQGSGDTPARAPTGNGFDLDSRSRERVRAAAGLFVEKKVSLLISFLRCWWGFGYFCVCEKQRINT